MAAEEEDQKAISLFIEALLDKKRR